MFVPVNVDTALHQPHRVLLFQQFFGDFRFGWIALALLILQKVRLHIKSSPFCTILGRYLIQVIPVNSHFFQHLSGSNILTFQIALDSPLRHIQAITKPILRILAWTTFDKLPSCRRRCFPVSRGMKRGNWSIKIIASII
jgi:hypothetical protein